jgi:hypothetical protein
MLDAMPSKVHDSRVGTAGNSSKRLKEVFHRGSVRIKANSHREAQFFQSTCNVLRVMARVAQRGH